MKMTVIKSVVIVGKLFYYTFAASEYLIEGITYDIQRERFRKRK